MSYYAFVNKSQTLTSNVYCVIWDPVTCVSTVPYTSSSKSSISDTSFAIREVEKTNRLINRILMLPH